MKVPVVSNPDEATPPIQLRPVLHNQSRAALVAGVSAKTISRWRKSGKLKPRVIDGIELYRHEDIERLANEAPVAD